MFSFMRPAHFLYSCQSGWYKNSQTAVSAPVRKQLRIIKSLREAKVESFSNLMFSVWWTTPEGRGGGGGGGSVHRLYHCVPSAFLFFTVFSFFFCFPLLSHVFPFFPMFFSVFLCFPLFSPVSQ